MLYSICKVLLFCWSKDLKDTGVLMTSSGSTACRLCPLLAPHSCKSEGQDWRGQVSEQQSSTGQQCPRRNGHLQSYCTRQEGSEGIQHPCTTEM